MTMHGRRLRRITALLTGGALVGGALLAVPIGAASSAPPTSAPPVSSAVNRLSRLPCIVIDVVLFRR